MAAIEKVLTPDLAIIGAGSGGLAVAAGAVQMGASVVLVEKGAMGGDCLNTGCVPSKSLIAAAEAANAVRGGARFGVNGHEPEVDFAGVHAHIHQVIGAIAPHDSIERFEALGVTVLKGAARFSGPREIRVGDTAIRARRFVIATGSSPAVPPIAGLDEVPYLTNESVFDLTERPDHLIVIGGGPIGLELAQAFRRLGAKVTVLDAFSILPKDDPEAVAVVRARLAAEGVVIREGVGVERLAPLGNGVGVTIRDGGAEHVIAGSHLLLATGRKPNFDDLGLEAAGIAHDRRGVTVDDRLRTTNKRVFAIGDIAGGPQFTHMAGYHAGIVIRNALFRLPAKAKPRAVPWVTYTDPELAQVGMSEASARERHGDKLRVMHHGFEDNDRARAERATEGFVKAIADNRGRILGATIVARHAGELILPWVLAIDQRLKIGAMASLIAPYPTLGEASKRAAGAFYTPSLFSERTAKVVRLLAKFG